METLLKLTCEQCDGQFVGRESDVAGESVICLI